MACGLKVEVGAGRMEGPGVEVLKLLGVRAHVPWLGFGVWGSGFRA